MKKNRVIKPSKKSISSNILIYFIAFSVFILLFLWIFQITFLNTYYKISRTKQLNLALNNLVKSYDSEDYRKIFDEISINNDVCIEIIENNIMEYNSRSVDRKCMTRNNIGLLEFQTDFISNDEVLKKAEIINPNYNNKTLVIGKKIKDNTYIFVNTSLVPLDDGIKMLKNQFIYIAFIILLMSTIVSYFISKRLSIPIIRINNKAKFIGQKNYDVSFDEDTNILELDELSNTLNKATRELGKTDEIRRELMANVSHDLKTPLTLIRAYAEAARDLDYDKKEKREQDLNVIVGETERLTILVNDILELSKLESNVLKMDIQEFNLKELINSLIAKFDILKNDGYIFNVVCDDNIIVKSDIKKLEQVIYNLVNNAINYTGDDKIVTINVIKKRKNVRVEVTDTGQGISKENLELIWDKYYKVDKTHKRNKYGTGLGLSIVKSTLINLGYKYGVNSKIGEGTTFYFEIK